MYGYKRTTFDKLCIGQRFYFDVAKDASKWIKRSSRTVELEYNSRRFYASKNDIVFISI